MAEQQQQQPPAQPSGQVVDQKEAEELLKQTDLLKEQLNQKKKLEEEQEKVREKAREEELEKMRQMEERLKYFEAKEEEERKKYEESQKETLNEVLDLYKDTYGQELPDKFKEAMEPTFLRPEFQELAGVMASGVQKYKKEKEEKEAMEAKLNALEERLKKFEQASINASKSIEEQRGQLNSAVGGGGAKFVDPMSQKEFSENAGKKDEAMRKTVNASSGGAGGGGNMGNLFAPDPSAAEIPFLKEYGFYQQESGRISVNASAGNKMEPPKEHNHLRGRNGQPVRPYSMRFSNPAWFAFLSGATNIPDGKIVGSTFDENAELPKRR